MFAEDQTKIKKHDLKSAHGSFSNYVPLILVKLYQSSPPDKNIRLCPAPLLTTSRSMSVILLVRYNDITVYNAGKMFEFASVQALAVL